MSEKNIFADIYLRSAETIIFQLENCKRKRKSYHYDSCLSAARYTLENAKRERADCLKLKELLSRIEELEPKYNSSKFAFKSILSSIKA